MCRAGQAEKLAAVLTRLQRPAGHASRSHDAVRRAKALGQNFLYDRQVLSRFAAAASDLNSSRLVIEIGAGPGGLTTSLLAAGAQRVVAVERDAACVEALCDSGLEQAAQGKLRLIHGDARKIGLTQICDEEGVDTHSCVSVVGNLPFSVGTRLLVGWVNPPESARRAHRLVHAAVPNRGGRADLRQGQHVAIQQALSSRAGMGDSPRASLHPRESIRATAEGRHYARVHRPTPSQHCARQ